MSRVARQPARAFIAMGSNLGDREAHIDSALHALDDRPAVRVIRRSTLHETEPVGPAGQGPYLNGAAELGTTLPPRELLDAMLAVERALGRDRDAGERWGPRTIDLDLLVYDRRVIEEAGLHVPHPRLHERRFVLEPLCEIAPDLRVPTLDRTVRELLEALRLEEAR